MKNRTSSVTMAAVTAAALVGGCRTGGSSGLVELGEPHAVSSSTAVGSAPMFAVSATGAQAAAWVSAPGGGTDGRLYVSIDGAAPVELRDPLGPIEAHGEAPPKIEYAADGSLSALYVVARVMPGLRFPVAALRFVRSTDGGRTWSRPVTVTDDKEFGSHNFHALHSGADGALYLTWLDSREGKSAPFLTRSTDGGNTWERNRRVSAGEACPCCRTAIATGKDGSLYVAWRTVDPGNIRDVVVARSTDHGVTFSQPVIVHHDGWVYPGCPHAGPSMRLDQRNRIHITWWTGREGIAGVHYARSDDGGRSFTTYVPLGTAEFSQPAHVQLALGAEDQVVVAWDDGTRETPQVLLRLSRNGGRTFGPAQPVSSADRAAMFPVLAVTGDDVTVAWSEHSAEHHRNEMVADSMQKATNPNAPKGLHAVGEAQVIARRGKLL